MPRIRSASTRGGCVLGMIKSSPSTIIAQGTDWRFFNELKRELKGG